MAAVWPIFTGSVISKWSELPINHTNQAYPTWSSKIATFVLLFDFSLASRPMIKLGASKYHRRRTTISPIFTGSGITKWSQLPISHTTQAYPTWCSEIATFVLLFDFSLASRPMITLGASKSHRRRPHSCHSTNINSRTSPIPSLSLVNICCRYSGNGILVQRPHSGHQRNIRSSDIYIDDKDQYKGIH